MFKLTKIELGVKKVGTEVTLDFPYENIKLIKRMESPCDCSIPTDFRTQNKVQIKYTAKPVPQHLLLEGKHSYRTEKNILINYLDNNDIDRTETLTFTATITG